MKLNEFHNGDSSTSTNRFTINEHGIGPQCSNIVNINNNSNTLYKLLNNSV